MILNGSLFSNSFFSSTNQSDNTIYDTNLLFNIPEIALYKQDNRLSLFSYLIEYIGL